MVHGCHPHGGAEIRFPRNRKELRKHFRNAYYLPAGHKLHREAYQPQFAHVLELGQAAHPFLKPLPARRTTNYIGAIVRKILNYNR
jgi:hypothetical protein